MLGHGSTRYKDVKHPSIDYLEDLGYEADRIMLRIAQNGDYQTELKADSTKVTAADKAIHDMIVSKMKRDYPHIPILGEEGGHGKRTGHSEEYWLLMDELDGTAAFTCGVPTSVSMIALMRGDRPIKSVIADPFAQRMYSAESGRGLFMNEMRTGVWGNVPENIVVDVVCWPKREMNNMLIPNHLVARDLHEAGFEIQMIGSIGQPLARVASGEFHATVFPGWTLHDTAPGDLIVSEAGGKVTDLRGKPLSYGGDTVFGHISACNEDIHERVSKIVRTYL